jgi:hypothetical protein
MNAMIEIDGVVYANDPRPEIIRVKYVKPIENYKLFLTFTNGKQKIFDMTEYLEKKVYQQLRNLNFFNQVYVSHGTVAWSDDIDIDPDTLYIKSESAVNYELAAL